MCRIKKTPGFSGAGFFGFGQVSRRFSCFSKKRAGDYL
jgi:hypothetical protein